MQVHVSFLIDMLSYFGILILNLVLIDRVSNFYCVANCQGDCA